MASQRQGQQEHQSACLPGLGIEERGGEDGRGELVFSFSQGRDMKEGSYREWQRARTSWRTCRGFKAGVKKVAYSQGVQELGLETGV